jgi:hypothetical protein
MTAMIDNGAAIEQNSDVSPFLFVTASEQPSLENKMGASNASLREVKPRPSTVGLNFKPEDFIAFQMSGVPEQRGVFVYHADDVYYVSVLVENRDLDLNRRIFERLRAVMAFYRQHRFDFSIYPMTNRQDCDIVPKGKRVL